MKRGLSYCFLLFAMAFIPVSCGKVGLGSDAETQIAQEVYSAIGNGTIPGAVVAVVKEGRTVYLNSFGNRQVVPDTVEMSVNTVFDLASLSKCVGTTLSFLQLVEKGEVGLNDKVKDYIPDFKSWTDPDTGEEEDITILHLLTHSSGLDPEIDVAPYIERFGPVTPDSLVHFIATEGPRNFRPGSDCLYSCLNFITLGGILEKVTGERLCDYAQTYVFDPLGLKYTCYNPCEREEILPLVAPTEVQPDGKPLIGYVHDPTARVICAGNSGNAGVFSNAGDLAVIAKMILNNGKYRGRRILEPETVAMMFDIPEGIDPKVGRTVGWDVFDEGAIWHTGYTGTSILMDKERKFAVIILTNRVHPYDDGSVMPLRRNIAAIVGKAFEE